jgi:hypothetical protein
VLASILFLFFACIAMIQLVGLVALWVLKASPLGILFPILIALLVPLRLLMGRFFNPEHLEALDADEEVEDLERELMLGNLHP